MRRGLILTGTMVICAFLMQPFIAMAYYDGASGDIMLQAFCWRAKWQGQHGQWYAGLTDSHTRDRIWTAGFTVLWFPPPSKTIRFDLDEYGDATSACGYMPLDYYDVGQYIQKVVDRNSGCWYTHASYPTLYGTKTELRGAITTFHILGIKVLADVVLNHRAARQPNSQGEWNCWGDVLGGWTTGQIASGMLVWGRKGVDEDPIQIVDVDGGSGGPDTGEDAPYAADINFNDSGTVDSLKLWLQWLKSLGFNGWRYDMVKGYKPEVLAKFNVGTNPYISVGDYWDVDRQKVLNWIEHTHTFKNYCSMAFDLPMRDELKRALANDDYSGLRDINGKLNGLVGLWPAKTVSFVDNHVTWNNWYYVIPDGPDTDANNWNETLMAYAFILSTPGIPCVYWKSWADDFLMRPFINNLILARKAGNVGRGSAIRIDQARNGLFAAYVGWPNAEKLAFKLGPNAWTPAFPQYAGWVLKVSGERFKVWVRP